MGSSALLMLGLVAIGVALATLVLAASLGAGDATGVARSLALIEKTVDHHEVSRQELPVSERLLVPMLNGTRGLAFRLSPAGASDRMTRLLDLAGNPGTWTAERIMGFKGAGLIGGAVVGFLLGGMGARGLLLAAGGAAAGFFLPDLLLYNLGHEAAGGAAQRLGRLPRHDDRLCRGRPRLRRGPPAGGPSVDGPVAGEFARVLSEIQIGKSRGEAFSSMGARTTVPEAKNFISALVQADRLGLPIASVLREQSNQMRLVRRQLAEEKAQKVPVKILFPMLLFIFPALFIVIIGPGAIRMIDTFSAHVAKGSWPGSVRQVAR